MFVSDGAGVVVKGNTIVSGTINTLPQTQKAKIFVSKGAYITDSETFYNATIITVSEKQENTRKSPKNKALVFHKEPAGKQSVKAPAQQHKFVYNSLPSSHLFSIGKGGVNQAVLSFSTLNIAVAKTDYFILQQPQFSKEIASVYTNPYVPSLSFEGQCFTRPPTA